MNLTMTLVYPAHTIYYPEASYSDDMLSELLAQHEDLIVQFSQQGKESAHRADFCAGVVTQHEQHAARLREHLVDRPLEIA